jgi:shikimate 5-dehydrogenase
MQTAVPPAALAAAVAITALTTALAAAADTQAAAVPTGQTMLVAVGLITAETISQTHQAPAAAMVQYKLQDFNQ